jgi:transketolase
VLEAFTADGPLPRVRKLAVRSMPASAKPAEQLRAAGLDAGSIASAATELAAG